jgi:hypothetical protein
MCDHVLHRPVSSRALNSVCQFSQEGCKAGLEKSWQDEERLVERGCRALEGIGRDKREDVSSEKRRGLDPKGRVGRFEDWAERVWSEVGIWWMGSGEGGVERRGSGVGGRVGGRGENGWREVEGRGLGGIRARGDG